MEEKNNLLVWVGRIERIEPIPDADRIVSATAVCGEGGIWRGVIGKGSLSVGDICNVFLQDAILPNLPQVAFMEKNNWRVKMARFRGAPSECLIVEPIVMGEVGTAIGNELGVVKYEKKLPPELAGLAAGGFPSFIPKTDEPNWQTSQRIVNEIVGIPVYATVKVDGSSGTAWNYNGKFGVASRNLSLIETETNSFWKVVRNWGLEDKLPDGYAVQFELYGEGIQGNPLGVKGIHGAIFNLYDINLHQYKNATYLRYFCELHGLPMVEVVMWNELLESSDPDYLLSLAEGFYPNTKTQREGIVIRPMEEFEVGQRRASVKVINLLYKD